MKKKWLPTSTKKPALWQVGEKKFSIAIMFNRYKAASGLGAGTTFCTGIVDFR